MVTLFVVTLTVVIVVTLYKDVWIHKPLVNRFLKLRHILSAINAGTNEWAKTFIVLFL